jgi:hypothetical protein
MRRCKIVFNYFIIRMREFRLNTTSLNQKQADTLVIQPHHLPQMYPTPNSKGRRYLPPTTIPNVICVPLQSQLPVGTPQPKKRSTKQPSIEKQQQILLAQRRKVPEVSDREVAVKAMLAKSQRVAHQELITKFGQSITTTGQFSPVNSSANTNVANGDIQSSFSNTNGAVGSNGNLTSQSQTQAHQQPTTQQQAIQQPLQQHVQQSMQQSPQLYGQLNGNFQQMQQLFQQQQQSTSNSSILNRNQMAQYQNYLMLQQHNAARLNSNGLGQPHKQTQLAQQAQQAQQAQPQFNLGIGHNGNMMQQHLFQLQMRRQQQFQQQQQQLQQQQQIDQLHQQPPLLGIGNNMVAKPEDILSIIPEPSNNIAGDDAKN